MSGLFKFHPSLICSALLFSCYALAILIVFLLPIFVLAKAALVVLLAYALFYYLRRDAWLMLASSALAIRIEGNDIALLTRGGGEVQGRISGNSVVTPVITILNILPLAKKGARYVVIFPDSMERERFRELRVLLKWGL